MRLLPRRHEGEARTLAVRWLWDRLRGTLRHLALVLWGMLVGLLIAEAATRILFPQPRPSVEALFVHEPGPLGFRLGPDLDEYQEGPDGPEFGFTIVTNSYGLRDDEISTKTASTFRILVLGDSYTFGYGASPDEAYPQVVERLLNTRGDGWRYDVLNGGVPAYTISQERAYLERYGLALEPDLVIVTVTRNDVDAAALDSRPLAVDASGYLITPGREAIAVRDVAWLDLRIPAPLLPGVFLQLNSHLYRLAGRYVPALIVDVVRQSDVPQVEREFPDVSDGVRSISRDLERMENLAAAHDAAFAVVIVPDPTELPRNCRGDVSRAEPHYSFVKWSVEDGVALLNVLPRMCREANASSLRWPVDGHFKPEGYQLIGGYVADFLEAEELLPADAPPTP